ncbi:uncharacterized protein LOC143292270 [Babylonia areolata]|uniref:uncharacterized protein LOC143292270 n=1 Tax=Babylonia areolata TaxID=304850 RepID=UPI003FD1A298
MCQPRIKPAAAADSTTPLPQQHNFLRPLTLTFTLLVLFAHVLPASLQEDPSFSFSSSSLSSSSAGWPCPSPCQCREDHVAQVGRTWAVLCSGRRGLRSVPDLAPLVGQVQVPLMLKMDYCDVGNVSRHDFPEGLQLSILHLNGNAGLRMSADALQNVRDTLVLLDLQAVNLPFNDTLRFLGGLHHLQELSLSFNNKGHGHTPHVTAPLFRDLNLTALTKLKLYNCDIRSLGPEVFEGAESLEELHLGANRIEEMPPALGRLSQLQVLDLSSNALSHLPNGSLSALTRLAELKLHMNGIEQVEDGAFAGVHGTLSTLVMSFCSLREVPTEAIRPLINLTTLDLTGNLFNVVGPDAFVGSYCLTELYVSSRTISFDKLMFTGQKFCIKDLKIRQAGLTSVPLDPIKDLVKLQYLFLDKNNISTLQQDELKGITATSISFSDNPLRTIEKGAFNGLRPKLVLLLERTELSDLSFIFDYPDDTFRFLSLYESPIPCDCTLKRILASRSENFLYGTCSHDGQQVNLKSPNLSSILSEKCRFSPVTLVATLPTKAVEVDTVRPYSVQPQAQQREKHVVNDQHRESPEKKRRKSMMKTKKSNTMAPYGHHFVKACHLNKTTDFQRL